MKIESIVKEVKSIIIKDLFVDLNSQKCLIDVFLKDSKEFEKREMELNRVSLNFLNKCRDSLAAEANRGNILFLRKYAYEKILNEYLEKNYEISNLGMDLFPVEELTKNQEKKIRKEELENKRKRDLEEKRLEEERILQDRRAKEQEILSNISRMKWNRIRGIQNTSYEAVYFNNKKIEVRVNNTRKKKVNKTTYVIKYDDKPFQFIEYDGESVIKQIEQTKPQTVKKNNITITRSKTYTKEKEIDERELKRKQEAEEKRKLREERRRLKEERLRLEKEEMRRKNEKKRLEFEQARIQQERLKQQELEREEMLGSLSQIGVKDFVVRRSVFKCTHSKHEVVDLDAVVRIIGKDDKEQWVKISAGYCQRCKVYFIMESTYERLKNMGDVILCRICDEKTYMKNSYVNGMKLAQESILMQYGYNVSQVEGLSAIKRQKILAVMIDKKILSKSEVISYLDFFISQRQHQSKFELAVSKWEADRDFIQDYRVGHFTEYGISAIYRK